MAGNARQKLKLLYLKELFERRTDEEHGVSMDAILSFLSERGIDAERKSIYSDIEWLQQYGMDIVAKKGRGTEYMLLSREFQLPELKLLVDAVGASRFITRKKSLELIGKLEGLTSVHNARELRRQVFVDNRIKNMNESIYYNVDAIHTAIAANKKLSFKYFDYSRERARVMRRSGEDYTASPLALIYSEEKYYLAAYSDTRKAIVNYRVDRMAEVCALAEDREQNRQISAFDAADYLNSQFSMFGGGKERVGVMFHNSLSSVVLDRFGDGVFLHPEDADHFSVTVEVEVSPTFFSWVFMFGANAYITSPKHVVEEFALMTRKIAESYPESF
ncbi:MAG: WYL domain-containing protein [Oscillospiraceae bacterium]|nr:WYL domain-containing protein [Oscillospiraceae bacterium]